MSRTWVDPFRTPPLRVVEALRPATGARPAGAADRPRWALAVALGALGRYGAAQRPLLPGADRADGAAPVLRSLAASTRASHLRQLGRHAAAEDLDRVAEALAGDDPDAHSDALLGLVADAVGRGDPTAAARRLQRAERAHAGPLLAGHWRPALRLGWVRAEYALLVDDPAAAAQYAGQVLAMAGSQRHRAKTLLVYGVALAATDPARGYAVLCAAARTARRLGALPLVWPAALMCSRLAVPAGFAPVVARSWQRSGHTVVRAIWSCLPETDAQLWKSAQNCAFGAYVRCE